MNKIELSIITVSYNASEFIEEYLLSLQKHLPKQTEVIIVDNNSQDDTVQKIRKYSFVQLIENPVNSGFSRGCNMGAAKARGEYLLFLNHDIKINEGAVEEMIGYFKTHPEVGLVGPQLVEPSGMTQQSVTHFPTLMGAVQEYILGQKNKYTQYSLSGKGAVEVDAVYGAAMLLLRDSFHRLGGFDERYFLFYEDIDLCKRIHQLGKKVIYLPSARFGHVVGGSMKGERKMPFGVRTLSWFWPIKASGSRYFMIKSAQIYHGFLVATLIRILMYLSSRLQNLYTEK